MYLKVVSSGAMMPTRPPPSIDMFETVIRPSIERPRIADPVYSMAWPVAPPIPIRPMIPRMMSLAVTPGRQIAVDADLHLLRAGLDQRLGRQDVLDLRRADPERDGAERPVGGGVAVAADDGHARQGQPELRADDVDDAHQRAERPFQPQPELCAVAVEGVQLLLRDRILDRQRAVGRGDVVVGRGDRQVGAADLAAVQAQALERLRRRDLVDEVQVDVEERRLAGLLAYDVVLPDFLEQRPWAPSIPSRSQRSRAAGRPCPASSRRLAVRRAAKRVLYADATEQTR